MKSTKTLFVAAAAVLTATASLAHHVDTPLSYIQGENILGEVTYYHGGPQQGFPGYILSTQEHHPHSRWAIPAGSSFSVVDEANVTQTVTFQATQFADMSAATMPEITSAINAQLTHSFAEAHNSFLHFRSAGGGVASTISVNDGASNPLSVLGVTPATTAGQEDLVLDLSIPGGGHHHGEGKHGGGGQLDLAHHPYLVLMSTRDGSFQIGHHTVPIGRDRTTRLGMRLIKVGATPSFQGVLNHNSDAVATFDTSYLDLMYDEMPSEIYFAFLVFSQDGNEIEFVSNRFTMHIQ